jgi:hypothetical protein
METIGIICAIAGSVLAIIGLVRATADRVAGKAARGAIEQYRAEITEKKIDALPCKSRGDDLLVMKTKLDQVNEKMKGLPCKPHEEDIFIVKTRYELVNERVNMLPCKPGIVSFSAKASPRKLNEHGQKLFDDIDGKRFLEENKEALFRFIKERKPLTAYDIEHSANWACWSLVPTPAFNRIKDYIYEAPPVKTENNGQYEITINDACFVLSLPLRDAYLEEVGVSRPETIQNEKP